MPRFGSVKASSAVMRLEASAFAARADLFRQDVAVLLVVPLAQVLRAAKCANGFVIVHASVGGPAVPNT